MYGQAMSVGDVNRYVKLLMDNDEVLSSVSVVGEISNLKYHTSGHIYFTLKDNDAELPAVMFRSAVSNMRFVAKNGMQVTAYGKITIYEKGGKCQIYVSAMVDNGIGNLQLEFERLFHKLTDEGLFLEERKKSIPRIPKRIGIITSPTGAALRDMINVTGRRWPAAKILLYPSLVQGADAPDALCVGLEYFNADSSCDVIIIGRGGGSIEDLWAFNDERVVRAVAASDIPVISAVGHETDFTLCDFAADKRAPTPSAAAELAVPDKKELAQRIDDMLLRVETVFARCVNEKRVALDGLSKRIELCSPSAKLENGKKELNYKYQILERLVSEHFRKQSDRFCSVVGMLEAMNPLSVLARGYSVISRADGGLISTVSTLELGESIDILFADGSVKAEITEITANGSQTTLRKDKK